MAPGRGPPPPATSSPDLIRGSKTAAARLDPRVKPADDGHLTLARLAPGRGRAPTGPHATSPDATCLCYY
jgi:hypothetical protein